MRASASRTAYGYTLMRARAVGPSGRPCLRVRKNRCRVAVLRVGTSVSFLGAMRTTVVVRRVAMNQRWHATATNSIKLTSSSGGRRGAADFSIRSWHGRAITPHVRARGTTSCRKIRSMRRIIEHDFNPERMRIK